MYDEIKEIKFRNNGEVFSAHAVDLGGERSVSGNFMVWTGAFRIYNGDEKLVGKICFQQSTLLDYIWANPDKKRFPPKEYVEEALVNLLHYLPFDSETLMPDGESFIFRFVRDLEGGRHQNERIFDIKVNDSMEKTYQTIIYGDSITDEKVMRSILEPLYMHRLDSHSTNVLVEQLVSILPFDRNRIESHIEFLEYKKCVDVLRDTQGTFISAKIRPEGVEFLMGMKSAKKKISTIKNIRIGHNFNIKTGDNSPVNIKADIDASFENIKREVEIKNPDNKDEILNDLNQLQTEIKTPKDLSKIKSLLSKITTTAGWVGKRVEPIVQQVIASYISSQLQISPTG